MSAKQRGILMSALMVQAILAGRKTQTRRDVKFSEPFTDHWSWRAVYPHPRGGFIFTEHPSNNPAVLLPKLASGREGKMCPHGQPGDLLWVRESHYILDCRPEIVLKPKSTKPRKPWPASVMYKADDGTEREGQEHSVTAPPEGWRERYDNDHVRYNPGRWMPKFASRLWLEITDVRVQRRQDISIDDAIAEGIEHHHLAGFGWRNYAYTDPLAHCRFAIDSYRSLSESINGPDAWRSNPWVWAITFKRTEKPQ